MKFFIDTANLGEIKEAQSLGILDGVTTNPSLVAKESGQKNFNKIIKTICGIAKGPVSAEVLSTDYDSMIKEGKMLSKIDKKYVMTNDGNPYKWIDQSNLVITLKNGKKIMPINNLK